MGGGAAAKEQKEYAYSTANRVSRHVQNLVKTDLCERFLIAICTYYGVIITSRIMPSEYLL